MAALKSKRKDGGPQVDDFSTSILARLTEEYQQISADDEFANDVSILFCGPKRSGKTSLVERFTNPNKDEKDVPKPTVALDYKFARYAAEASSSKVLAHIYDLGGDESNEDLIAIPMSANNAGNLVLAVVVDLSEPHNVLPQLEKWLKLLQAHASRALDALAKSSPSGAKRVEAVKAARAEVFAAHPDAALVNPFPVELIIFAAKWDVFVAEHDPEKRKGLGRALRHFSHVNGASLVMASLKEKGAMNAVRGILRQTLFGASAKGGLAEQVDASKPLCMVAGKDSFQNIGGPGGTQGTDKAWRELMADYFPDPQRLNKEPRRSEAAQVGDELLKFPESSVDGMVEQRREELQAYRRQAERNQRLASEGVDGRKDVFGG